MMTNLKLIREEKGLSQRELANAAGLSKRTLQEYEQGRKKINKAQVETVLNLASALGVKPEKILE